MKGDKKVLRFKAKLRNVAENDRKRDFVVNYCEKYNEAFIRGGEMIYPLLVSSQTRRTMIHL